MTGRTILHYRIVGVLGSGGMGVLYDAEDLKLGRHVALKFLPAELAANPDALQRLQREARAASNLNHPSICTVYAIEQADTEEGPRHFIAMERLEGQSLDQAIAGRPLATEVALEIGIQIADALDAAHARGIIHRDIKPGNIFVQARHRAKVLDFGLAKLAAARVGTTQTMPAEAADVLTSPGTTLGTVAYMSPEQARGDELDARTDLFSFGAVLYEMCTGRVPFGGKTSAVIFQKILDRTPEPPRAINPSLPSRFEEIILKALEKDRDLRCQTAAELRADLKRLQRDTTSGHRVTVPPGDASQPSAPLPIAPVSSGAVLIAEARRHKFGLSVTAVAALALMLAAGFGIRRWLTDDRSTGASREAMTIARLTSSGAVLGCTSVSPDGRNVVYCETDSNTGRNVLRMRQVATGATIKLADVTGLPTFSPDGQLVYLRRGGAEHPRGALFVLPALGGGEEPRRVLSDIAGAVTVSPDGEQLGFVRNVVVPGAVPEVQVVVARRDGSEPRTLHVGRVGDNWANPSSLAWSRDGKVIAAAYRAREDGLLMSPVVIDVASGKLRRLTDQRWANVFRTVWLHDGTGLVFAARQRLDSEAQLWMVSYPVGEVKRITNDLHDYGGINVDVDANDTIVARQSADTGHVWISDAKGDGLTRLTSGSGSDRVIGWIDGERVVYLSNAPVRSLWTASVDGAAPKRAPVDVHDVSDISIAPGQNWITYHSEPVPNLWRVNLDGTARRQLTHAGYDRTPRVLRDGSAVLYDHWGGGIPTTWKVPSGGGAPVRLSVRTGLASPSPDGQRYMAVKILDSPQDEAEIVTLGIFRLSDGALERSIADGALLVRDQQAKWSVDGRSIVHVRTSAGVSNLWALPLERGEPQQLTHFESERIFGYAFSPDGSRLAMSRGRFSGDIVQIRNFR